MDSLSDLLKSKAQNIDVAKNEIHLVQNELDRLFKGRAFVRKIDHENSTMVIFTESPSTATEVRFAVPKIILATRDIVRSKIEKIQIRYK